MITITKENFSEVMLKLAEELKEKEVIQLEEIENELEELEPYEDEIKAIKEYEEEKKKNGFKNFVKVDEEFFKSLGV